MIDATPRRLWLEQHYADGEDARHFTFRLDAPHAGDGAVRPGQFFMLCVPGVGEAPFTYVRPPDPDGRFSALVRRMGRVTDALFACAPGALLGYRGPFGHGWPHDLPAGGRVLAVAGGCGLAPLASMIEDACAPDAPWRLTLLYGARHAAAQVLGRERARWRKLLPLFESFDQPPPGQRPGTPLDQLDRVFAAGGVDALLCCGPEPLMLASARECLRRGLPAERIWLSLERRMHCADGLCGHCYLGASYVCRDGPTYRYDHYLRLLRASGADALPAAPGYC